MSKRDMDVQKVFFVSNTIQTREIDNSPLALDRESRNPLRTHKADTSEFGKNKNRLEIFMSSKSKGNEIVLWSLDLAEKMDFRMMARRNILLRNKFEALNNVIGLASLSGPSLM